MFFLPFLLSLVLWTTSAAFVRLPGTVRENIFGFAGFCWGAQELIAKPRLREGRQIWEPSELNLWSARFMALGKVLTENRDDYGHIPCGSPPRPRSPEDLAIEDRQLEALEEISNMPIPRAVLRWWILGTPPVRGELKFFGPKPKSESRRFLRNRALERTVDGVLVPRPAAEEKRISQPSHFPGRNGGGTGPNGGVKYHRRILDHSRIPFRAQDVLGVPQTGRPGPRERAYSARAKIALALGVDAAWEQMPNFFSAFLEDASRLFLPVPVRVGPEPDNVCPSANAQMFPHLTCPPKCLETFSERDEAWLANVFFPLVNGRSCEGWNLAFLATTVRVGYRTIMEDPPPKIFRYIYRGILGGGSLHAMEYAGIVTQVSDSLCRYRTVLGQSSSACIVTQEYLPLVFLVASPRRS